MGKEATSQATVACTEQSYTYTVIESTEHLAKRMLQMLTATTTSFAVVRVTLHFENEGYRRSGQHGAVQSVHYFLSVLRRLVRKTDVVYLLDHTFYFLLFNTHEEGGKIVQDRLWDALLWSIHNIHDGETVRPQSMSIGHHACPTPPASSLEVKQCIAKARTVQVNYNVLPGKTTYKAGMSRSKSSHPLAKESELSGMARKSGIPYLTSLPRKLPEQVQQLVSPGLAQELHCYPLGRERGILTVAMSDPQDSGALNRLQQETGLHIFPVLAHPHELQTALEHFI